MCGVLERLSQITGIMQDVCVSDHHALGSGSGTGGVLQVSQVSGWRRKLPPFFRKIGMESVRRMPAQMAELRRVCRQSAKTRKHLSTCQRQGCLAIFCNRQNAQSIAVQTRRVRGNSYCSRVKAAKKRSDEFQSWRIQQQRPLALSFQSLQKSSNQSCPGIQLAIGQARLAQVITGEKNVSSTIRKIPGSLLQ